MADLDPNPQSLDQAYDLGFCDMGACTDAVANENILLRAQLLDRCARCELHRAVADLVAMERSRDIWRFAAWALAFVLSIPALIALAEGL
jgi:hypothetical protein